MPQQMQPAGDRAALYMRLSREDGTGESASISTQRGMLRGYAQKHGFSIYDEYIDDGYSGTNFDRPAWQRMIADIEKGQVNVVLAKDLSRIGRDYIMAGQYTELFFPAHGVRCIAVNDGYDSAGPFADLLPFKNVMNELYARDISQKIRGALHTRMEAGVFIGNSAPYGYRKDPQQKGHLMPDPGAAPVVQQIFHMAAKGMRPSQIAAALNRQKILPPAAYRAQQKEQMPTAGEWGASTICKMLHNVVYLGHLAQGKTTKLSFKSSLILKNPQEKWSFVRNAHAPLVPQAEFALVQKRAVPRRPASDFSNIFAGIAKCADCGRNLSSAGTGGRGKERLVCGGYKLYGKKACSSHSISYDFLYQIVLQDLRAQLACSPQKQRERCEALQAAFVKTENKQPHKMAAFDKHREKIEQIIRSLYEDRVSGLLTPDQFQKLLSFYEGKQKALLAEAQFCRGRNDDMANENLDTKIKKLLQLASLQTLTPQILCFFIDKITVGQSRKSADGRHIFSITIYYPFAKPQP